MNKILMYSTGKILLKNQTGGIKRFVELAKYLQHNYKADLCCQDEESVLNKNQLRSTYVFCEAKSKGFNIMPPEANRLWENRKLLKQIKDAKYDSIISFDVPPTIGLCMFGINNIILMVRKDLIGYEKSINEAHCIKKMIKLMYLWLCEDIVLRKCKRIIVQCEYDKIQLLDRHKIIRNKIEKKFCVQINNVNPSWACNKSQDVIFDNARNTNFSVGFIGNFNDRRKGHDLLLDVAEQLIEKGYSIKFDIIGGGKELQSFQDKYENEKIVFWGRVDNPISIISKCDLTVVPSRADSCPNTVMESLFNEIPVIGANVGGIPEILLQEEALFEIEVQSLLLKIEELYLDRNKLSLLLKKQKERKKELEFNWAERITDFIIEE